MQLGYAALERLKKRKEKFINLPVWGMITSVFVTRVCKRNVFVLRWLMDISYLLRGQTEQLETSQQLCFILLITLFGSKYW